VHVTNFLRHWSAKEGPAEALERLKEKLSIVVRQYDDRVVLNYSQIETPKMDPMGWECRGLILSYPDFSVVSRTFDRFFNYGETFDTQSFDFSRAVVQEKVDGSLMPLYHDGDRWQVATRGTAFAEAQSSFGTSFREIFKEAVGVPKIDTCLASPLRDLRDWVFIFEMVSPETRVVKHYGGAFAYLLCARNRVSGAYMMPESAAHLLTEAGMRLRIPQVFSFGTVEDLVKSLKSLPTLDEGYVCVETVTGRRVKVKNPSYVAIHHLRDNGNVNPKRVVSLVWENETEEYLSYFPEDKGFFVPYKEAYARMMEDVRRTFECHRGLETQKEFALAVKDLPISGILFALRKGDDLQDTLDRMHIDHRVRLLDRYLEP
jgi:hypothetical protein